ncbi:unnamed protein product [Schistocephalus solidus]|uniref:Movement protein n=1 Tax=Schistocephalus solidus TaxID=70667 RepID=A0A183T5M4_SCHSO|nr:unnamed protein product [Schistocephalus solidus]
MERFYPNFYSLSSAPAEPLDPRFKPSSWALGLQALGPLGLERPPLDPTVGLATYDGSTVSGRERSVRTQRCSNEAPISRRVSTFLPDALTKNESDSQQTSAVISDLALRSQNGFPVTPSTLRTPMAVVKPTVSGLLPYPSQVASSQRHSLFEFPTRIADYGPLTASPLSTVRAKTNAVSPRLPENWSLRRRARRHPELVTTEPLGRRQFMPVTDNSPQPLSTGIEAGSDAHDVCLLSNWLPVSSTPTMHACSTYPWAVAWQGKPVNVCACNC